MKKIYFTLTILFLAISSAFSQDSLYVYKNGLVETKFAVYDIDSLSFSNNLDTLILSKNSSATNSILIANIDSISFFPELPAGTYIDIDGNRYTTVTIGTQTWMVENLKTTRYRNGDTIPEVKENAAWINLTTDAYSNYANDPNNGNKFGRLYNWYAVNDSRNLAPAGWHLPSVDEWLVLQNYLIENGFNYDGSNDIDKISKSLCSTTDWAYSSNAGAPGNRLSKNNSTGFNGLPAGGRLGSLGSFFGLGESTFWWTSSNSSITTAYYQAIFNAYSFLGDYSDLKTSGRSIRCIKSDLPILNTYSPSSVTSNSSISGGFISFNGNDPIIVRGVCWSTSASPTVNDNITMDGIGVGGFSSTLTGLLPGTTYYVRAFATNTVGTAYGEEFSFKTLATTPTITTMEISAITDSTATASGVIITDGGATITEKGFCWSINENPTVADSITTGTGDSIFIGNLIELNAGTVYYVRAYATNEIGTTYGQQLTFTTLDLPAVTTVEISAITSSSAVSGGNIISDGGAEITTKGVCWSTTENPTVADSITVDGSENDAFISNLTKLTAGTVYYVRAYATNEVGTSYGNQISFTTLTTIPSVTTSNITEITHATAISGGEISSNGGAEITAKGVCWSTTENPTIADSISTDGAGNGSFTSNITGLSAETVYYVRAYATNSEGTAYGNNLSFTTLPAEEPEEEKLTEIQIIPNWIDGGIPAVEVGYINGITTPFVKAMFNEQNVVYRFNPTAADLSKTTWAFVSNSARVTAPGQGAPGDNNTLFAVPNFTNNNNGTGTFNLKVENWTEPAVGETHLFALQAYDQGVNNGNPLAVSDYAKVVPVQYNAFISDATKSNTASNIFVHYRTSIPFISDANDFNLSFTSPVDLNNFVWATANKGVSAERRFETYGFSEYKFEFSLPTYVGYDGVTNQNSFVSLDAENILSVNGGSSALDRNPLVLIKLLTNDGKLVAQSYIKFKIVAN